MTAASTTPLPTSDPVSPFLRGRIGMDADGMALAPTNVIQSISAAREQYQRQRIDHLPRVEFYAAVEGQIGGNPPYDQAELDSHGLGHKANFNNFKARSNYERAAQLYWNLINATEVFIKVVLAGQNPQLLRWARTIARHFNDVIREWPDFYTNINLHGAQLTKFGWSSIYWPDEDSWMWETVDVSKCFLPSQTSAFASKLTTLSLESIYTMQDIYQIYMKSKDRKESPWNPEALSQFLIRRANSFLSNNQTTILDPMQLQRFVQGNESQVSRFFNDQVRLVNLFQQEYEGGISHYIMDRDFLTPTTASTLDNGVFTDDFLFFKDRQYKTFQEAFVVFTTSPGDWEVFSSLGVGAKGYSGSQAVNILDCTVLDMSIMSSTPLVRSVAAAGREISPIRFYPGTVTDIGASEFVQNQLGANISQLVAAANYLNQTIGSNAANSGDDPATPDAVQGTVSPTQFKLESFDEFGVTKIMAAHFYTQWDHVVRNNFIKFLNAKEGSRGYDYVEEWKTRCIDDGVPQQMFDTANKGLHGLPRQYRKVAASRVAGDGSTLARLLGLSTIAPIVPTLNADQLNGYKTELVEAALGVDQVPNYTNATGIEDENKGGASLAVMENYAMQDGKAPFFSPDNDQEAHISHHMEMLVGLQQGLTQQQISPVDADKQFAVAIPHAMAHMQFMATMPLFYSKIIAQIQKPFGEIVKLAQLNRKNALAIIEKAKRDQEQLAGKQETAQTDAARKDFIAQSDVDRKNKESAAKLERAQEASNTKGDIMRNDAARKGDIEQQKTESKIEATRAVTLAKTSAAIPIIPIDKTRAELATESPGQLSARLNNISGVTPSTEDFS